jgi:flagellar motor switch protein FliN/FliY
MNNPNRSTVHGIQVPVEVILGRTVLNLEELEALKKGSIIALENLAGEPVDLSAAGTVIAQGEVVVIDENFGIRITSLKDGEDG